MFLSIEAVNFRSFSNITLDFYKNKKNKEAKKIITIYGENGSGKSNIVEMFSILSKSVKTVKVFNDVRDLRSNMEETPDAKYSEIDLRQLFYMSQINSLPLVIRNCKTIESTGNMKLSYKFVIQGNEGEYRIEFDESNKLVYERLDYLLGVRKGNLYEISYKNNQIHSVFSPSIFKSSGILNSFDEEIDKLWGRHSFLAILSDYSENINKEDIEKNIKQNIFDVLNYFNNIGFSDSSSIQVPYNNNLLLDFEKGVIDKSDEKNIKNSQELLYTYFSSLYSDIKDIEYEVKENFEDNTLEYSLYIYKMIEGDIKKIPFELESKGTKKILDLLPIIINTIQGNFTIVDEIDEGIHDLLINNLLENASESVSGQLIFTTHNTYLMKTIDKSSVYIINSDSEGHKSFKSLDHFDVKVNNNMQNMYLNGSFGGTPYPSYIDFDEFMED